MAKRWVGMLLLALPAMLAGCGASRNPTAPVAPPAPAAPAAAPQADAGLAVAIAGDWRSPGDRARDAWRHPRETLEFFGIRPDMTVVEIWPAGGWYTEILAPYLRDRGRYIAAHWDPESKQEFTRKGVQAFKDKLAARPDLYGKVQLVVLAPPDKTAMVAPESVDMVLTFRNIHNWLMGDHAPAMFAAMYRVLKPGGVLGVVEHRARADRPQDPQARTGYVREDQAVALAEQAGFLLEAASEINANPRDSRDYPGGVWTLPPTLREGAKDRDRYLAIGESDRFTLRFRKPGSVAGVGEGAAPVSDEEPAAPAP